MALNNSGTNQDADYLLDNFRGLKDEAMVFAFNPRSANHFFTRIYLTASKAKISITLVIVSPLSSAESYYIGLSRSYLFKL